MNSLKSKIVTFLLVVVSLSSLMEYLYFQQPHFITNINNSLIDQAFIFRGERKGDDRIVVIDIDEKSLKELGQWPWSRNKLSKILENLTNAGVGIIGLDMVFSEPDRSSPRKIAKDANLSTKDLPDFDEIFAQTLTNTPTITGFTFNFEEEVKNQTPNINAIFIQKGKVGDEEYLLQAKGITSNLPLFQQSAYSAGSFNTVPDEDGNIRYVPLLISYEGAIYPSLSFEMIRAMLGVRKVIINYDENGVTSVKLGDIEIPTDSSGRMFVDFAGGAKSFRYISALDIYNNSFKKSDIEGKVAILGTSAAGLLDLRAMPFDKVYPGVEVHANVIDNIINNNIISSPSYAIGVTLIAILLSVLIPATLIYFLSPAISFFMLFGYIAFGTWYYYKSLFSDHILLNFAYPLITTLVTVSTITFLKIYFENRQKEVIKEKFAKKVSPQVAAELLKNPKDVFSAKEAEITIFFSDVRNFTTISEGFKDPKDLISYLNDYMSPMSSIIIEERGTIDKYIGDAIMAYWNAPTEVKNHPDRALRAAIRQIEALKPLNEKLKQNSLPLIDIGIGLHTGVAIAGEMGSEGRSDYTIIGDSVNLASRIEGLCKPYGAKILISEFTKSGLKEEYKLREIDRVKVKGKDEAVTLYEVLGFGNFSTKELEIEERYMDALKLYKKGEFRDAYKLFNTCYDLDGHKLFALYMDRCATYIERGVKEFDGVYKFETK